MSWAALGSGRPGFLDRVFREHPRSVGESYAQHFGAALSFAARLAAAAGACFAHALVPCVCQRTASRGVAELHARMVVNRRRLEAFGREPDYAI